ncbi:MAG: metal-dependent hydrolase [Candidatus Parcubacteria bacterium]|nr:MAG: metal-dependent hydrolase [Candidatus Parcubacteria bacterium]
MRSLPLTFSGAGEPHPVALPRAEELTLVVHSGRMHADDVFAAAIVRLAARGEGKTVRVDRSRNPSVWEAADIVADVGGAYDPMRHRFDHHQPEGAGNRPNGIPYAAVGLVWKHYGMRLCDGDATLWAFIDERIVAPIDAADNGVELCDPLHPPLRPLSVHTYLWSLSPSWDAPEGKEDDAFFEAVGWAETFLRQSVMKGASYLKGLALAHKRLESARDGIAVLGAPYPFEDLAPLFPQVRIVVRKRRDGMWHAVAMPEDPTANVTASIFPAAWAGLTGEELAAASGVSDAVFCHRGCWMCVARSREGAVALARKALEAQREGGASQERM